MPRDDQRPPLVTGRPGWRPWSRRLGATEPPAPPAAVAAAATVDAGAVDATGTTPADGTGAVEHWRYIGDPVALCGQPAPESTHDDPARVTCTECRYRLNAIAAYESAIAEDEIRADERQHLAAVVAALAYLPGDQRRYIADLILSAPPARQHATGGGDR